LPASGRLSYPKSGASPATPATRRVDLRVDLRQRRVDGRQVYACVNGTLRRGDGAAIAFTRRCARSFALPDARL
jgi:hypothetical protein